jgi:hypothetical protein
LAICSGNVKRPLAATASRSPPLFHSASVPPLNPATVPLTVTNWLSSFQFWLEPQAVSPRHRPSGTSRRYDAKIDVTLRMMFTACMAGKNDVGRADSLDCCTQCCAVRISIRLICIDLPHSPRSPALRSTATPRCVLSVDRGNFESACRS